MIASKPLAQPLARGVVADDTADKYLRAQRTGIDAGIGGAARHGIVFALTENEHWRLARDTKRRANDVFVRHQIAHHQNALSGECAHQAEQAVAIQSVLHCYEKPFRRFIRQPPSL